ncbi:Phosphoglycerate kinase like protein, partial [Aduncisulcus paluster]
MNKLSVEDVNFEGKRVVMRCDYNVPLDKAGKITNNERITATLPTINHIMSQKPHSLVLMSHLGRPKGKRCPEYSLEVVAAELTALLKTEV